MCETCGNNMGGAAKDVIEKMNEASIVSARRAAAVQTAPSMEAVIANTELDTKDFAAKNGVDVVMTDGLSAEPEQAEKSEPAKRGRKGK